MNDDTAFFSTSVVVDASQQIFKVSRALAFSLLDEGANKSTSLHTHVNSISVPEVMGSAEADATRTHGRAATFPETERRPAAARGAAAMEPPRVAAMADCIVVFFWCVESLSFKR